MFFAPRGQRLYYFQTANFPSQCVDFFRTHSDAFQPFPRQPNASKTFEDVPAVSQTSSACRDHRVRKLVWKFKRDKSVEKQQLTTYIFQLPISRDKNVWSTFQSIYLPQHKLYLYTSFCP